MFGTRRLDHRMSAIDGRENVAEALVSVVAGLPSQSWGRFGEKSAMDTKRKNVLKSIKVFLIFFNRFKDPCFGNFLICLHSYREKGSETEGKDIVKIP